MDSTGRFVVGTFLPDTPPAADQPQRPVFRWDGEVPTLLPVPDGTATGVNRHGAVVGTGNYRIGGVGDLVQVGWIYHEAYNYVVLPVPEGYTGAAANAINDKSEVVGVALKDGESVAVVIWAPSATGYLPRVFEASPGVQANDITEDGTVVGREDQRPYAWAPDGTVWALPLPAGAGTGAALQARGAWAVGHINADVDLMVRWNLRTDDLVVAGEYPEGSEFAAISTTGDVAYYPGGQGSVIDHYGERYALPFVSELPDASRTGGPVAISDNGRIVAGAYPESNLSVLWRC
jgi:uncharacterized membrane protein